MTKADTTASTNHDTQTAAETYFSAWRNKDFATLRSVLADDATFRGPLGKADDADACIAGLKRMSEIVTDIDIRHTFVDGHDVLTWFDLHTTVAKPSATANWSHVENGKITSIQVTFDARELAGGRSN